MTANTIKIKAPPHTKESEMMVLGCMLTSINSLNIAADSLDEGDFYHTEHKLIFQALKRAYKNDKPADILLISEELKRQEKLDAVGGIPYLTTLAQYAGTSAYIEEYIDLIKDKATLRRMMSAAQTIEKNALSEPEDVGSCLDEAQQLLFKISQSTNKAPGVSVADVLSGVESQSKLPYLKELEARQEKFAQNGAEQSSVTGMKTEFIDLDKMINGLNNSHLLILAARPAMGKTALAINIAENVCFKSKVPVGIFSLEMSAEQLVHRIICSQSEVESDKIRSGALSPAEFQKVVEAVHEMQKHTMLIDDQPGLKITDLRARARRMKETHKIGLVVIDYLQLISGSGTFRTQENRQNEISEISRTLKTMARELDVPIICLAQLSRKVEERAGHRPLMSDLRESGCLAGDTLITCAETGTKYTMKELATKGSFSLKVHAFDPKVNKISTHTMIKAFPSGKKDIFVLTTKTGRSIKATSNHPFLKKEGFTPLESLRVGDIIAISPQELEKDKTAQVVPYWDEISSISYLHLDDVYDATVEDVHNFVANGIVVHNSIEQDADIIMLLLRHDYYDPNHRPGQAKIFVAKNRHGAVGEVTLAYRKELAQFVNYTPMNDYALKSAGSSYEEDDPSY